MTMYGLDIPEIDELECYEVEEESFLMIVNLEEGE